MKTNSPDPRTSSQGSSLTQAQQNRVAELDQSRIDWLAARRAQRACCCTAAPAVIAVMPPSPGRPHSTELFLCGHHYRASRRSLEAAGAVVLDMDGRPVTEQDWSFPAGRPRG